jgi:hypothetical protein
MVVTQVFRIFCGPTSAPLYPYGPEWQPPLGLAYWVEQVDGTWRVVPPPVEEEVPPGAPPAVSGPYASSPWGAVLDLDGQPVELDQ